MHLAKLYHYFHNVVHKDLRNMVSSGPLQGVCSTAEGIASQPDLAIRPSMRSLSPDLLMVLLLTVSASPFCCLLPLRCCDSASGVFMASLDGGTKASACKYATVRSSSRAIAGQRLQRLTSKHPCIHIIEDHVGLPGTQFCAVELPYRISFKSSLPRRYGWGLN